jgi:calcium-dependent protein kinase
MEKREGKGKIAGTAFYMAPEVFTGTYDERCDIWSLGIILFILVTG